MITMEGVERIVIVFIIIVVFSLVAANPLMYCQWSLGAIDRFSWHLGAINTGRWVQVGGLES